MYIETRGNIFGQIDFDSFETTDIIQFSSTTFHYNRFSDPASNLKLMGQFRCYLMLSIGHSHSKYIFAKKTNDSTFSTDWSF